MTNVLRDIESPWGMTIEEREVARFTEGLAYHLGDSLAQKGSRVNIGVSTLDQNSGFMINIDGGEIMVTRSREKRGALTINRFHNIRLLKGTYSPDGLRETAQIYDNVTALLNEKFGEPISEHDGRAIYRAFLEEKVTA